MDQRPSKSAMPPWSIVSALQIILAGVLFVFVMLPIAVVLGIMQEFEDRRSRKAEREYLKQVRRKC